MRLWALSLALLWALPGMGQVSLHPSKRDGQPIYVFENKYIRSEIAHTRGRSPLSYFDKIAGVEQLRQLEPLDKKPRQTLSARRGRRMCAVDRGIALHGLPMDANRGR